MSWKEAPHCSQVSKANGTSQEQYQAGLRLVELAFDGDTRTKVDVIEQTRDEMHRPWIRISMTGFSCRAIVENTGTEIVVHAILPRDANTYNVAEELWKQFRSPR